MDLTGELGFSNNSCKLKNILPTKTKKSLYRAFILPYFNYVTKSGIPAENETLLKSRKSKKGFKVRSQK